jgi:hypothetical protein
MQKRGLPKRYRPEGEGKVSSRMRVHGTGFISLKFKWSKKKNKKTFLSN